MANIFSRLIVTTTPSGDVRITDQDTRDSMIVDPDVDSVRDGMLIMGKPEPKGPSK